MTSKAGHTFTAGPAKYDPESGDVVMADEVGARIASVDVDNCANVNQADADGLLIAEAFTVAHETGLTPRQLAEQRAELLAALREIETICTESATDCRRRMGTRVGNVIVLTRAAIAKAEGGAA